MQTEQTVAGAVMLKVKAKAKTKGIESLNDDSLREHALLDIGIKSLQLAIMLTSLCADLQIDMQKISDLDIVRMRTVGDVIDVLVSKAVPA